MLFSTKARTLESVQTVLAHGRVVPQVRFTVTDWHANQTSVIERVLGAGWPLMAVRSSAVAEDSASGSLAGRFESVLGVDQVRLPEAIQSVASSMVDAKGIPSGDDEIFVQPMLSDVVLAGVAFGLDPATGSPYYVINYDDASHRTDSVTAGASNELKTLYIHHLRGR